MSARAPSSPPGLSQVARLYYVRGLTKLEIGDRLGISRFKVTRLLEQAREQGVVRIEIDEPVPVDDDASRRLEVAFGLAMAIVVPDGRVAQAAAAWLPELIEPGEVLGVAWGRTLSATAELLAPRDLHPTVVQICGAVPGLDPGTSPTEVAMRFADKLSGRLVALPAPAVTSADARRDLIDNDAVRPAVELFDRVTTALVGVGVRGDGGHVLTHVFDEHGSFEANLPALALPLERLRDARVVALASGTAKGGAVLGALRTGLVDVLVTDGAGARKALSA
jgi:DNA-binding transcriptional regulator LsrR (DeoR family)